MILARKEHFIPDNNVELMPKKEESWNFVATIDFTNKETKELGWGHPEHVIRRPKDEDIPERRTERIWGSVAVSSELQSYQSDGL